MARCAVSLVCLLLGSANGYRVGLLRPCSSGLRTRAVVACEQPKLAAGLQVRQGMRERPPTSKGLLELLAPAVARLKRLFSMMRLFFSGLLRRLIGTRIDGRDAGIGCRAGYSAANLCVVQGLATRDFAPPDDYLLFFDYRFSPFYAEVPSLLSAADDSAADETGDSSPAASGPSDDPVRWLRHRRAQNPSDIHFAASEARLQLLRELYDEAKQNDQRRSGSWRGFG